MFQSPSGNVTVVVASFGLKITNNLSAVSPFAPVISNATTFLSKPSTALIFSATVLMMSLIL